MCLISIIAMIAILLIIKLFKKFEGQDLLDIASFLGGKYLMILIGILYLAFMLLSPALLIRDFSESLKIIYFKNSPILYIILFFIIGSIIANKFNLKVIAKVNLMIIPVILFSIFIVLFANIRNFSPERLFPILGNGADRTFLKGLTNIYSFHVIGYLFFLPPFLNKKEDFKSISMISFFISSIYLILSIICLILSVSFILVSNEPLSLYLITRMIAFGKFIQRIDALFIFVWILSCLSYISISLFFVLYIFKKITKIHDYKPMVYCFGSLLLGLILIPRNISILNTITDSFYKYGIIFLVFIFSILILIFANMRRKRNV